MVKDKNTIFDGRFALTLQNLFYIKNKNCFTALFNWILFISFVFVTVLFSTSGGAKYNAVAAVISVAISFYLFVVKKVQNRMLVNLEYSKGLIWFSIVITAFAQIRFGEFFHKAYMTEYTEYFVKFGIAEQQRAISTVLTVITCLMSFTAICICLYFVYSKVLYSIKTLFRTFDKTDKRALKVFSALFILLIIIAYSITYIFWGTCEIKGAGYDIIYTTDTGALFTMDCWLNVGAYENDLRQPLFGAFSAPFTAIPYAASKIMSFVPNLYPLLMAIEQAIILLITVSMITKMMKLQHTERAFAYVAMTLSFPVLLFSLNLEQYIFAVFWLILLIYSVTEREIASNKAVFIAATGSLLTSAVMLPLIYDKEKGIGKNILSIINTGFSFVAMCFLFGKGLCFVSIVSKLKELSEFSGKSVTLIQRLKQYSAFVRGCFVYPKSTIDGGRIFLNEATGFDFIGIALLVLTVVGFILNRKSIFAKISFAWVCFSFVMLALVGWGSAENGMILYTLYFGWAFCSLVIMLINKIPKYITVKRALMLTLIVAFAVCNLYGIFEIIKMGASVYSGAGL